MHRLVAEARFENAERRTARDIAQGNCCLLTNSFTGALSLEVNRLPID